VLRFEEIPYTFDLFDRTKLRTDQDFVEAYLLDAFDAPASERRVSATLTILPVPPKLIAMRTAIVAHKNGQGGVRTTFASLPLSWPAVPGMTF